MTMHIGYFNFPTHRLGKNLIATIVPSKELANMVIFFKCVSFRVRGHGNKPICDQGKTNAGVSVGLPTGSMFHDECLVGIVVYPSHLIFQGHCLCEVK